MNNLAYKVVRILSQSIDVNVDMPFHIESVNNSIGTGFFIDSQHILTCAHVISSANPKKLFIEIPAQKDIKQQVTVLGFCPDFDIALLKTVKYKSKHYFKLENNGNIEAGKEVYAVGFPFGTDQINVKISKGVISGRDGGNIQTDSAINPGNSGGPLILNGKVVGINRSKMIVKGTDNIGYASPIKRFFMMENELKRKKDNLVVRRPQFGFEYCVTNNELHQLKGSNHGVYVTDVYKKQLFDKCGIKKGDILTKLDGQKVDNHGQINKSWFGERMDIDDYTMEIPTNKKVKISLIRDGKPIEKMVEFKYVSEGVRTIFPTYEPNEIDYEVIGGIVIMNLSVNHVNDKALYYKYIEAKNRVDKKLAITKIFRGSEADNLNIFRPKDIICKVNGKKVDDLKGFRNAMKNAKKGIVLIETENAVLAMTEKSIDDQNKNFANTMGYKKQKK